MSQMLRLSTARTLSLGPAVATSDGFTLVTSLATAMDNATTGIKLSKNGGALTVRHATVGSTNYDSYGNYLAILDTTDTNTLGLLRVQFAATTNLPIWQDFEVVPAAVWDALMAASGGAIPANIVQLNASSPTFTQSGTNFYLNVATAIDNGTTTRNANLVSINSTTLTYTLSGTNLYLNVVSTIDNATTVRNVNVTQINSSANAAAALSFASNDTNNRLYVDSLFSDYAGSYNTTANKAFTGTTMASNQTFTGVNTIFGNVNGGIGGTANAVGMTTILAATTPTYNTNTLITAATSPIYAAGNATGASYASAAATGAIYTTANATSASYAAANSTTLIFTDLNTLLNDTGSFYGPTVPEIVAGLTNSALLTTTNIYAAESWLYFQDMTVMNGTTPAWKFESLINIMGSNSSATNTAILAATGGGGTGGSFSGVFSVSSASMVSSARSSNGGATFQ